MLSDQSGIGLGWSGRRLTLFPVFAALGIALPLTFIAWVDRYLYYLRPLELIPTYGTAWLLMVGVIAPFSILFGLALYASARLRVPGAIRYGLGILLLAIAATAIAGAVAAGGILWLRSFGVLKDIDPRYGLTAFSVCAGALLAVTRRGRAVLLRQYSVAKYGALVGAIFVVSLPFFGWSRDTVPRQSAGDPTPVIATSPARPNILLLTIDTLSAEHMSLYGASRQTTPNLDAFAKGATTLDRAYANGNFTTAGIASILTGTRPWTHRAIQLPGWPLEKARENSLPAILQGAGYQTGYVNSNPWASAVRNGLGTYFVFGSDEAVAPSLCHDWIANVLRFDCAASELLPFRFAQMLADIIQQAAEFDGPSNWQFDPRPAISSALGWLTVADKRTPIFLWVHLMPPHSPYAAPEPWLGQFNTSRAARSAADSEVVPAYLFSKVPRERAEVLEARYDESIKYVDHYVGEFLSQALPLLGDNTVVVVTADHGESFAHGYGMHTGPGLFESIIRIPLLIKFPGQTVSARSSALVEQADIAPTLAALAGVNPAPKSWEGLSLKELEGAQGSGEVAAKPIFSMNFEQNPKYSALRTGSVAVVESRWKLVHYMGSLHYPLMPPMSDALFDLSVDPGETSNRISDQPAEARHLLGLIKEELDVRGGPTE